MPYPEDLYNMKDKSNQELHDWLAELEPGSNEYIAGVQESMRRVALIEEQMEKNEAPVWKREWIAMGIAVLSIAVSIIAIITLSH